MFIHFLLAVNSLFPPKKLNMAPQSSTPSEIDIWFNHASVALAKSERLVAGLLPPPTETELRNAKTQEQIQKEEQEMFTVAPDLYVMIESSRYGILYG